MERSAGILMPLFSLPSPYGIGGFGREAHKFIDFLSATGQKCWQVLPLNPTSYGDSPYQSPASSAGNPYFIDLDLLQEKGLLTKEELRRVRLWYDLYTDCRLMLLYSALDRCVNC